jgi:hypothetical protein
VTWNKKGVEFSDECADTGLSDGAYRTHDEAIGFVYRIESDELRIKKHLVQRFAGSSDGVQLWPSWSRSGSGVTLAMRM